MEAFSLSRTAVDARFPLGGDLDPDLVPGDFATGQRRLPPRASGPDFAAGMRTRDGRPAPGHFAGGQSWHPEPYVGRGDFAVGLSARRRVTSAVTVAFVDSARLGR
jgi:hypothetical protein